MISNLAHSISRILLPSISLQILLSTIKLHSSRNKDLETGKTRTMNTSRPDYKPFEARLIQLLRWRFEKSNLNVIDHLKVGDLPLEIDVVAISTKPGWIPDLKFPQLFDYFRQHNVMEIKTEQDRFEVQDLPKLLAYGWHYMAKQSLEEVSEVTLTALVHHLTPRLEKALPKFGFEQLRPEVYRRNADMISYVIAFGDLPDELLPEELRAFTNQTRRQHLFLSCLGKQEKSPIVEAIVDLYESEVRNIMLNIREESLRNILSVVEEKRIISALGEEKIIAALSEEKIIAALLKNEHLLKALLAELDVEQLQKMLEEKKHN